MENLRDAEKGNENGRAYARQKVKETFAEAGKGWIRNQKTAARFNLNLAAKRGRFISGKNETKKATRYRDANFQFAKRGYK